MILEHHPGSPLAKLLPELSMLACVAWFLLAPASVYRPDFDALFFVVVADGATLMASATLIDVASRIRRAPPWWIAPLALGALLLLYPEVVDMLKLGWSLGFWILLPFAWSMLERLREVWTLPSASPLEKIRRRTVTFDRMYTAMVIVGLWLVVILGCLFALDLSLQQILGESVVPWPLLVFYAINAGNVLRVHRPSFARAPRSLWPRIDEGQSQSLDPL